MAVNPLLQRRLLRRDKLVVSEDVVDFHPKQSQSESGSLNQIDHYVKLAFDHVGR
jgi:hypothetical protein